MDFEINEIKVDVGSYRHYFLGTPGIGKSTTFRDLVLRLYNNPRNGLLIVVGEESGHKALSKLQFKETPNWEEFLELVDWLVENKDKQDIKMIGIDTVDELVDIASKQVMHLHFIQKKERATSLKACFGGYGAGKRMVMDLVEKEVGRLNRAGYSLVYIGHTKFKDLTDKETDNQYQQLTSNLENDYHAMFSNRCDITAMMMIKRNIKDGKLLGERRIIRFIPSLNVESKTRISGLPEEIDLSADAYVEAVESALKKLSGLNDKEFEKKKIEEVKNKAEESKKTIEKEVESTYGTFKTTEEYKNAIKEIIVGMGSESKSQLKADLKAKNLPEGFTQIEDINQLKQIYALAKGR